MDCICCSWFDCVWFALRFAVCWFNCGAELLFCDWLLNSVVWLRLCLFVGGLLSFTVCRWLFIAAGDLGWCGLLFACCFVVMVFGCLWLGVYVVCIC